ncbi:MAG: hypothetical protein IT436_13625 [Phycisphaerales bacterium]|nr:hypothetical protein [Phycisphaerales bacterium]
MPTHRRRVPRMIYLANGPCRDREVPETAMEPGRDSFVVEHRPPGSARPEYHRYALVDTDMAIWVDGVERPAASRRATD